MVWPISMSRFRSSRKRGRRAEARRHRPRFEALEDRYLLTTVTSLADSGAGSLRDAIASTPAGGTITFQTNLTGTINLSSPLSLHSSVTINGPGPLQITVSGADATQVFGIDSGVTATITGLTIAHGASTGLGAGITNAGTLNISTCTFTADVVSGGTVVQAGAGAIANSGTLAVDHSAFVGNLALQGINSGGGAILNQGTGTSPATATLTNCTLTGNQGLTGGAIFNQNANLTLVDCTIARNSAGAGSQSGGLAIDAGSAVTLQNTLIALNTAPTAPDVSGLVANPDHNLIGDGTGSAGLTNGVNGNQVGTAAQPINPKLTQFLNFGSQTETLALQPGSPAIGAGNPADSAANDQRGIARSSATPSIGAFEFQAFTSADAFFAAGAANNVVDLISNVDGSLVAEILPFNSLSLPTSVAIGDFTGSGFPDLVVAAGAGNPHVRIFSGLGLLNGDNFTLNNPTSLLVTQFFAYGLNFNIGANVAVGDVSGNGIPDLVTGASAGNPQVKVYDGAAIRNGTFNATNPDASLLAQWFAYGLNFNVGANVAVGDLSHNGFADVVTGATAGNPHVKVYSGQAIENGSFNQSNPDASLVAQFFPYALEFNVGAFVAVGDVNGDGFPDLITGSSVGNPDVRVYDGHAIATGSFDGNNPDASLLTQFFAFPVSQGIGVSVAAADFEGTGRADIVTGATSGTAEVRVVNGLSTGVEPPVVNGIDKILNDGTTPLTVGA